MMRPTLQTTAIAVLFVMILTPALGRAADDEQATIEKMAWQSIQPAMERYGIPGMAVGIVIGKRQYVCNYGVASKATARPVTNTTLFEIGSVSKTFTATLASYAQVTDRLSLSDSAGKHLPSLRGGSFDRVSLLNLATHTSGGLPLQVPDGITSNDQLMKYLQSWKPAYPAGTYRLYSNVGVGMLGMITAKSMNGDFAALMQDKVLQALGMNNTFYVVPQSRAEDYAQGYTKADAPIRMAAGVLAPEAYGVRSTARDVLRFVEANMGTLDIDPTLQAAITNTHTGCYRVGPMTQDLVWEQYHYPVELKDLLAGNSTKVSGEANPATEIDPPLPPQKDALINKTGSTNGFAAYVAFIPQERIGIVLLANKNYPIEARVTAAYQILTWLRHDAAKTGSDRR